MKPFCIWFTGLSGAGKTTLARAFIDALGRPVTFLDGDEVRQTLCRDLGYSKEDRDANVERIAFVANEIVKQGGIAVVACISPYREARQKARELIGNYVEVYMDTPEAVRMERKGHPGEYEQGTHDVVITGGRTEMYTTVIINELVGIGYLGTAFMLGRFQPWHTGHTALFQEALKEGRVLIGVRSMPVGENNPHSFETVKDRIERTLSAYSGRFDVLQMPNLTNIVYGRGVGYGVTRVDLPAEIEAISATNIRRKL